MRAERQAPAAAGPAGSGERQRADASAPSAVGPLARTRGESPSASESGSSRRPRWIARTLSGLRWLAPSVGLALIPKCPMCLAGYIALGTGLSVSMPVAEGLRTGLFAVCFAALGWLVVARVRRVACRAPEPRAQRCC